MAELKDDVSARRDLARAKTDVIVRFDPAGPTYIFEGTQEKGPSARMLVDDILERAAGRRDTIVSKEITSSEPGSRYIDFLLPGLIGMNLMGTSMWGVGYNLVVARKRRLLRRFAVTPMRRPQTARVHRPYLKLILASPFWRGRLPAHLAERATG